MRILGGCAALVGILELLNVIIAAGAVAGASRLGTGAALVAIVGVVSTLLLLSGLALLGRQRRAIAFARGAALAMLLVFALLAALRPGFSMVSMLLGIVFPIVMLLVIARRGGAHTAAAAR